MRDTIQKHIKEKLPPVPPAQVVRTVPSFSLVPVCNITSKLPRAQKMHDVTTFEKLGQGYGFVLYRTKVQQSGKLKLELKYQDRCTVLVNGVSQGSLFRGFKEESISVNVKLGDTLDILVENMGRVNYGPIRVERKGLLSNPVLDGKPLTDWEIFKLPFSTAPVPTPAKILNSPTLYTGSFAMDSVADTYLDVSTWGHGVVWVNGHNLGRYWNVGPTQTLYCPGVWLKKVNSVVVLEMDTVSEPKIQGLFNHKYELRRKFY
jgi:beta-galactosidase